MTSDKPQMNLQYMHT